MPHPPKTRNFRITHYSLLITLFLLSACTFGFDSNITVTIPSGGSGGETATVTRVIDGDTIDVTINGQPFTIRYIGVNTPERDESCYAAAKQANELFVSGKTVRLTKDVSEADRYGRLLRFVYVDNLFVNQALVEQGYAEAVLYEPDRAQHNNFVRLEQAAAAAGRGCHPTGIFNDGSTTR